MIAQQITVSDTPHLCDDNCARVPRPRTWTTTRDIPPSASSSFIPGVHWFVVSDDGLNWACFLNKTKANTYARKQRAAELEKYYCAIKHGCCPPTPVDTGMQHGPALIELEDIGATYRYVFTDADTGAVVDTLAGDYLPNDAIETYARLLAQTHGDIRIEWRQSKIIVGSYSPENEHCTLPPISGGAQDADEITHCPHCGSVYDNELEYCSCTDDLDLLISAPTYEPQDSGESSGVIFTGWFDASIPSFDKVPASPNRDADEPAYFNVTVDFMVTAASRKQAAQKVEYLLCDLLWGDGSDVLSSVDHKGVVELDPDDTASYGICNTCGSWIEGTDGVGTCSACQPPTTPEAILARFAAEFRYNGWSYDHRLRITFSEITIEGVIVPNETGDGWVMHVPSAGIPVVESAIVRIEQHPEARDRAMTPLWEREG